MQSTGDTFITQISNSIVQENITRWCRVEMNFQHSNRSFSVQANAEAVAAFRQMGEQQYAPLVITCLSREGNPILGSKNITILDDTAYGELIRYCADLYKRQVELGSKDIIAGVVSAAFALIGIKLLQYGLIGIIGGGAFLLTAALSASIAWKMFQSRGEFVELPNILDRIVYQHVARAKRCLAKGLIQMEKLQRPADRVQEYTSQVIRYFRVIGDAQIAEGCVQDLNLAFIGPS